MKKRKNVLLILADQQRLDTVSAYGQNDICKTDECRIQKMNDLRASGRDVRVGAQKEIAGEASADRADKDQFQSAFCIDPVSADAVDHERNQGSHQHADEHHAGRGHPCVAGDEAKKRIDSEQHAGKDRDGVPCELLRTVKLHIV